MEFPGSKNQKKSESECSPGKKHDANLPSVHLAPALAMPVTLVSSIAESLFVIPIPLIQSPTLMLLNEAAERPFFIEVAGVTKYFFAPPYTLLAVNDEVAASMATTWQCIGRTWLINGFAVGAAFLGLGFSGAFGFAVPFGAGVWSGRTVTTA
jgi:hypothetical protein